MPSTVIQTQSLLIHTHYNITLFPTYYLLTYIYTHTHRMDNTNNLYSEDDEFAFLDTQELPATFSRNINTSITNMDEAAGPSNSGVALSRKLADQALQAH